MDKKDIDLLVEQIRNVILNKPLLDTNCESDELKELQDAIRYLYQCHSEANEFLGSLCSGLLDVKPPSRHNFLAGNLKELQSVLKYLAWQSSQVAKGDYTQRVRFLGEFSDSFNMMICQLEEREIELREKSEALSQSMAFLVSIMDTQQDWVIVMSATDNEIIYTNKAASKHFYDMKAKKTYCKGDCTILERMVNVMKSGEKTPAEYYCDHKRRYFKSRSYPVEWEGKKALVHYLTDVTAEKALKENLSVMAYEDPLTGIFNRRYCIEKMEEYIQNDEIFTVVLIDLNDLKYVNDKFGHLIGDDYIKSTVDVMKRHVRGSDSLCRIGGDEFVILLKDCSIELTREKMDKIYIEVQQVEKPYPMSVSYGIASILEDKDLRPEDILDLSDSRMYAFKIKHKNNNNKIAQD